MANFNTHLTGGIISGAGASALSLFWFDMNIIQTLSIFILGAIGGILPDIDSDSGKPLNFIFSTISILIPALMLQKLNASERLSPEFMACYFVSAYIIINYLVCMFIKKLTVHRGIIHSIPFALLSGEISYLLFISSGSNFAAMVGLSVFMGCITHLIFDELNSLSFKFVFIPVLKKSSGTAFKMKSNNLYVTLLLYLLIFITTSIIFL